MSEATEIEVRPYRASDEAAILATFNRVFARVDPGFRPRTPQQWRWAYRDSPAGARAVLAVDTRGDVIAQYAGLVLEARLAGEPALICQSIDSMSELSSVTGLSRRGPFVACGEQFRDLYGGTESGKHAFVYGLPVARAWRLGRSALEYEFLREGHVLVARVDRMPAATDAGVEIELPTRFPAEIDAWFERAAAEHGAIAVRSARVLEWRFGEHPLHHHEIALARVRGSLAAYCVIRFGSAEGVDGGVVCDWMTSREDEGGAGGRALRAWLAARGRERGIDRWVTVLPPHCRDWLEFQRDGWHVELGPHIWAAHSHDPRFGVRWFSKHFYATFFDTDLA